MLRMIVLVLYKRGTKAMISDEEKFEKFVDFIPDEQYVLVWGFYLAELIKGDPGFYALPVYRALIQGLCAVADSKNKRTRERKFTVWAGDYGDCFWIGIPGEISSNVSGLLDAQLRHVAGFQWMEFGTIPEMPLIPMYAYDHGKVIRYGNFVDAGKEYIDETDSFGTGALLQVRAWFPEGYFDDL